MKLFLAVSLTFSLSACGYGSVAETAKMGPVGSGMDVVVGQIKVQEVLIINDGTNAVVTAVIVNSGTETETLIGIGVNKQLVEFIDTTSGSPVVMDAVAIAAKSSVTLSFTAPLGALLNNKDGGLPAPGTTAKVDFSFVNNGFAKVEALVFANEDIYSTVNPSAFAPVN